MSKHTEGPWINRTVGDTRENSGRQIYHGKQILATVHYGIVDLDEANANARLIAAAPDLLAVCQTMQALLNPRQRMVTTEEYTERWNGMKAMLEAAIAKAQEANK